MCLGKGIMAMCRRCKQGRSMQRTRALVLCSAAVRDNTGGIKADNSLSEEEPELHAHERVVDAHGGRCVGVGGNIQNKEGCVLHR
jgi:hypothetical protein